MLSMQPEQLFHALGKAIGLDTADRSSAPPMTDFVVTAWLAVVILALRIACEHTFIPIIAASLRPEAKKKARGVFDDLWIATFSAVLEGHAVYTTLHQNGGCKPWSTDPCLVGWPNHRVNIIQRLYFVIGFQYYLYEMLGTAIGTGTVLKTDMVIHHIATMGLITLGYYTNLLRYGTMWMALFDLSNPLLHLAKVMHAGQVPVLKDVMLPIFAFVFFVCRLLVPPYAILYPAFTKSIYILPPWAAWTFIALMVFVCILQVFWFYKIVQIARRGAKNYDKDQELKQE